MKSVIKNKIKGNDKRDVIEGRALVDTRQIEFDKRENIQYTCIYIETLLFFFWKNSQEQKLIFYGDL